MTCLRTGGVIAYPTEAVYGLGCDPVNESAVHKILVLKQRPVEKGLILIAADTHQLEQYIDPGLLSQNPAVLASWPGPHTWLFPCKKTTPRWLTGRHDTLAVRVTAHPVAAGLCRAFGAALVSTSANPANDAPAREPQQVKRYFGEGVDMIINGAVDTSAQVSSIREALTGKQLR
ncbi:MAG TPA: Sua5/YciO/YrdC/YwlC family protein [Gammaproteobacteria bacterium]